VSVLGCVHRVSLHGVWAYRMKYLTAIHTRCVIALLTLSCSLNALSPVQAAGVWFPAQLPEAQTPAGTLYFALGAQLASRGELLASEKLLARAVTLLPHDAAVQLAYAYVMESLDKHALAITHYEQAIKQMPTAYQARYSLGMLLDRTGKTREGVEMLKSAVRFAPDNAVLQYDMGVLYAKLNDYQAAAQHSHQAILLSTDFAEAYNNYAYALGHLGRYGAGLQAVEKSLLLKPDSAAALDSKGFLLSGMGNYEAATQAYLKAIEYDPNIGEIYLHLAENYEKLQQFDASIKAYKRYSELTPGAQKTVQAKLLQLSAASKATTQVAGQ
jgi:tetratricopeptide (TPR) repeat protein